MMMGKLKQYAWWCGYALALIAGGCGVDGSLPDAVYASRWPGPQQVVTARKVAADPGSERTGGAFNATLPHPRVTAAMPLATFTPNWAPATEPPVEEPAYCIYDFTPESLAGISQVMVAWDSGNQPEPGQQWYLGLAQHETMRWDWHAGTTGAALLYEPGMLEQYLHEDTLRLAVVLLGTAPAALEYVRLGATTPPVAQFTVDVDNGAAPLTVWFDATLSSDADGTITDYRWDFNGDGTVDANGALMVAPSHTYTVAKPYEARLTVVDNEGAMGQATQTINVTDNPDNTAPVAMFTAEPLSGTAPLTVSFDASSSTDEDGFITDFAWDWDGDGFDDNNGQGLVSPEHTFMVAGEFTVRLTVTDDGGLTDSTSHEVSVSAPES